MATAGKVKGVSWGLYKNVSGTYTKIGNATSHSLTVNSGTIDVTDKDSNEFQELLPSIKSAEASIEGFVRYDGSNVDVDDLLTDILAGTEITCLVGTNASGDKYVKFDAYLTSIEQSGATDDAVTFTASVSSTGTIALIPKT